MIEVGDRVTLIGWWGDKWPECIGTILAKRPMHGGTMCEIKWDGRGPGHSKELTHMPEYNLRKVDWD